MPTSDPISPSGAPLSDLAILIQQMLDSGHWPWVESLIKQVSDRISPDEVLAQICAHSGGDEVADRLFNQVLDQGANADILVQGPEGELAFPLAWAAIQGRKSATARLVNHPRATVWLNAPVGTFPLAHHLAKATAYKNLAAFASKGMELTPGPDGSLAWEWHPKPMTFRESYMREAQQALSKQGLSPATIADLRSGADRMSKGLNKSRLAELKLWIDHLASTIDEAPATAKLSVVQSWVKTSPRKTSAENIEVPPGAMRCLEVATEQECLAPVPVNTPRARAGTWNLASASLWSLALQGPTWNAPGSSPSAPPQIWQILQEKKMSSQAWDEAWSVPIIKSNGGTLTLGGMAILGKLEALHLAQSNGTKKPSVLPVHTWSGSPNADQVDLALDSLLVLAPHLDDHRQVQISRFARRLLMPGFSDESEDTPEWKAIVDHIHHLSLGRRLHVLMGLARSGINPLVAATRTEAWAWGEQLADLSSSDMEGVTPADIKSFRRLATTHPNFMFGSDQTCATLVKTDLVGDFPSAHPPTTLTPLDRPSSSGNQRMNTAMEMMERLIPRSEQNNNKTWHTLLVEQFMEIAEQKELGKKFTAGPTRPSRPSKPSRRDQLNWMCSISQRFGVDAYGVKEGIPHSEWLKIQWQLVRAIGQEGLSLPPPLAQALVKQWDPSTCGQHLAKTWDLALEVEDVHPAELLSAIGIELPPNWVEKLMVGARGISRGNGEKLGSLSKMETLSRAWRAGPAPTATPTRSRLRP